MSEPEKEIPYEDAVVMYPSAKVEEVLPVRSELERRLETSSLSAAIYMATIPLIPLKFCYESCVSAIQYLDRRIS